jgi:hypothetical protein
MMQFDARFNACRHGASFRLGDPALYSTER